MATKFIEDWRSIKSQLGNIINEVDVYNQNYEDNEAWRKKNENDIYDRGYKAGHDDGLKEAIHPLYLKQETEKAFKNGYDEGYSAGLLQAREELVKIIIEYQEKIKLP